MFTVKRRFFQIIGAICFLIYYGEGVNPYHSSEEKRLREELFVKRNIHADVRAGESAEEAIDVQIGMSIVHITHLDVYTGVLTLHAFIYMSWVDSRLKWNSSDYGGIDFLMVPNNLIWKPDLSVYNEVGEIAPFPYGDPLALIFSTGKILWVPPATIVTFCDVTNTLFPYDEHKCIVKFGSWTYSGFEVNIKIYSETQELGNTSEMDWEFLSDTPNLWEVVSSNISRHEKYYSCCEEPYPDVTFSFKLRRRSPYYTVTMVIPCFLFILLTLVSFWLPPMAGEKILLGSFNLLYVIILLGHMHWAVPRNSEEVPCIVRLCGSFALLSMLSLVTNIITVSLSRRKGHSLPPSCCQFISKNIIVSLCCLPKNEIPEDLNLCKSLSSTSDQHEDKDTISESDSQIQKSIDWKLVAMTIDRTLFYVTLFIVLPIILWYSFS